MDKNEITTLLMCGKKLEAIQLVTQRTDMTLKEAKPYVEKIAYDHNIKTTSHIPERKKINTQQLESDNRIIEVGSIRLTLGKKLIITFGLLTLSALLMFMMIKWRASQFSSGNRITRFDILASIPTLFVILIWIPINRIKAMLDGSKKMLIILGLAMAVVISVLAILYLWISILYLYNLY